jgi:uridine kinase
VTPILVGIAGGTGSGKTMLARTLQSSLGSRQVALVSQDAYYRDLADHGGLEPTEIDYDHPDALELDLLSRHLALLREGRPIHRPVYNFDTHRRAPNRVVVEPFPIVVLEGILILCDPELREKFDFKVFIDADADVRLCRRLVRDCEERGRTVETVLEQYRSTVRPAYLRFIEPTRRYADVIINNSEDEVGRRAFDLVVREIRHQAGLGS